ncbi:E3 ubiquitin-protein ligase TRIM7 [Alosa pseudoharengus]|uniref:E3 ubiquitin-protein ligase TRIM7 n=1 Tax=Alosa pseudoharengus TaxID=34774 RepID=UPI003F8C52B3
MGSMEEELTCPMCRDLFNKAHLLPCGHSFCPACVREAWAPRGTGQEGRKGRFTCLQCQEELRVVLCDSCPPGCEKERAAAVKTCLRCEVSLCAQHLQPHLDCPAFSSHLLVEPLGDLSRRRCPQHKELFRYFCSDDSLYLCADCILDGAHQQHRVRALKKVEEEFKCTLRGLLQKAQDKMKDGEKILKDHEKTLRTLNESVETDQAQADRLSSGLQLHVERLVLALRESTQHERQDALQTLQEDGGRLRADLTQTQAIYHYVTALLDERDPFLLVWALQCDDSKLMNDLNLAMFSPRPANIDRKRILEYLEHKYREFITATLRCLSDLKRELLSSPLSLDQNSAHPLLSISVDLRTAERVKIRRQRPVHPDRFDHWSQVLSLQVFSSGTHYWELEVVGFWDIAVTYPSIERKGKLGTAFGNNKVSWSLTQQHDRKLAAWHNRRKVRLSAQMTGNRVALALDYEAGTITFSEVGPYSRLAHLHTFSTTFTQPVCLGFGLYKPDLHSRISIVRMSPTKQTPPPSQDSAQSKGCSV